MAICFLSN